MKVREWPNKLGFDITVKGRTWECAPMNNGWGARLVHSGTYKADRLGSGETWLHAIANARGAWK